MNKQRTIKLSIYNNLGISHVSYSYKDFGQVYDLISLYVGDSRGNRLYTVDEFKAVSAHEFGHTLGLMDLYNKIELDKNIYSLMGSEQFSVGRAQDYDFEMMLIYRGQKLQSLFN